MPGNMRSRGRFIRVLRICSPLSFALTVALTGSFCLDPLFGVSSGHLRSLSNED
jgi:hypothetical protein